MELITAAFSAPNVILTVLFILVLFYWLTVILGAVDADSLDVDIDVDVDVDIDVDVDVDVDVDADLDVDADVDADADVEAAGSSVQSLFFSILKFFNIGKVPFMVSMSILIMFMWGISVGVNHDGSFLNPTNSFGLAALFFVPNFLVSAFIMKFLTIPLVPVFDKLDTAAKALEFEGQVGTLTTSISKDGIGQVKLFIDNSSVLAKARTNDGKPLPRGQKVLVVQKVKDEANSYIVTPFNHE